MASLLFHPFSFLTSIVQTIPIIIEASCLHFPLVLGAYITISLMKVPDLSIEAAYVCGAAIGTRLLIFGNNFNAIWWGPISILGSIAGGLLVGSISSLLTHVTKFPPLLSSILTMGIFYGVNYFVLGTANIPLFDQKNLLSYLYPLQRYPEMITLMLIFVLLAAIAYFFLRTQIGTSLVVYGNNPNFFEHYGISKRYVFIFGLLLGNGLAGMAGFFDAQSSGFVDITMGNLKALFAVTSIILGKTLLRTNKPYSILVPIVGTFAYHTIVQLLVKIHFNQTYFTMIQSLIVAALLSTKFYHGSKSKNPHDLGV